MSVAGFKSLSDRQDIKLRPITLLAGRNSSGKSSIMQPFLLMKQTLEAAYDPGALLLDGPNVRLTSARQAVSRGRKEFTVGFETREGGSLQITYKPTARRGFDVDHMLAVSPDGIRAEIRIGMADDEIRRFIPQSIARSLNPFSDRAEGRFSATRNRCFIDLTFVSAMVDVQLPLLSIAEAPYSQGPEVASFLQHLIHLPALRANPERTYRTTAIENSYPGVFESYVASILSHWQHGDNTSKLHGVSEDLAHLGLTSRIQARQLDDTRVELLVSRVPGPRSSSKDLVSIADVGLGVSQTLPVVVALRAAERGETVYLEEPELHLHPRAQSALADILAAAAKRGVRLVIETHSSLILRQLQTLVAKGSIDPTEVALHWFITHPVTGRSRVESAELDENGSFGEWPSDFDETSLGADRRYLDAVVERNLG